MGFYIELKKHSLPGSSVGSSLLEFSEEGTPQVFWALFGLAGFALSCMGLAAHSLLGTLLRTGEFWDMVLISLIFSAIPIYLLIGIKLAWVRRFVNFGEHVLMIGYRLSRFTVWSRMITKQEITQAELINLRPTSNLAPRQHGDSQYYIRGHWRLVVKLRNGKEVTLDRHTEKGALHSLYTSLRSWLQTNS